MAKRVSVTAASRAAFAEEKKTVARKKTGDSFQNFAAQLGLGTDNLSSGSTYGFNPISRDRILLEWIHRGNFIGGLAIDVIADDMTRAGIDFKGDLDPKDIAKLEEAMITLDIWGKINSTIKWGRLYGGALGIQLCKGQNYSTPWRVDATAKGSYCGLLVVDRWMVEPSLNDLVTDLGPHLGKPKFYTIQSNAPALRGEKIHYSRVIRMEGTDIPYQQRLMENLWTTSVLERVYDRLVNFDSATTGAAQLVYKAYLRVIKIPGLRALIAEGGDALGGLVEFVSQMRRFQSSEGITLLDGEDSYEEHGTTAFAGLAEALVHFGQQISGALQIPLVRLFGQSPSGLNSTGESDMRLYYDSIFQQQVLHLQVPLTNILRAIALSEGITLPDGFGITFRSLWQLDEIQKSEVASKDATTITAALEGGVIDQPTAMEELKQLSRITGRFTNISPESIAEAKELALAPEPEKVEVAEVKAGDDPRLGEKPKQYPGAPEPKAKVAA